MNGPRANSAKIRRFKPYPAYKDSGVEWLGKIPTHWEVKRLKAVGCLHTGGTPSGLLDEAFDVDGVPWVKPDHLQGDRGIDPPDRKLAQRAAETVGIVSGGSVLVCGIGTVGKTGFALGEVCTNQQINAITFGPEIIDRFGQFLAPCLEQEFARRANKVTIAICNKSEMGEASVCVPPWVEQHTITAFLDRETASIDALVAKKERLIELLQEKRTAVITRAVTKGLDPNVSMKDSGVEWLGEIPADWEMAPLFTVARERDLRNTRGEELNVLSLSYGRIVRRDISDNFGLMPESFDTYQIVDLDNIVLRLTDLQNDKKSLRVGLVRERGIITSAYVALNVLARVIPLYFFHLLHSYDVTKVFYTLGAGVRQTMKFEDLKWMPILIPKEAEQNAIAEFLNRETVRIDALIVKIREAIDRLKEYRTALISAAVTGKIDVREEVA